MSGRARNFFYSFPIPALALLVALSITPARAATVYGEYVGDTNLTGSRYETNPPVHGVADPSRAYGNFTINWMISWSDVLGVWNYLYMFSWTGQGMSGSHLILDLADNCDAGALALCVSNSAYPVQAGESASVSVNAWHAGPENPGFPSGKQIQGVQFDNSSFTSGSTLSFQSTGKPVWGDFYWTAGTAGVFNRGLAVANPTSNILDYIARPDTYTRSNSSVQVVPEPGTLAITGGLLLGLGVGIRRRNKR
jgi:hypothetical protein